MADVQGNDTRWPSGSGEMARRIRAHDWGATPIGPIDRWPRSLREAVDLMLVMPGPANVWWGPEHVQIYNDAYVAIARDRHPASLGRPARETWPEIHARVLGPAMDAALAGVATRLVDLSVQLEGPDGRFEERVFDASWTPIHHPQGGFGGALEVLFEVTDRRRALSALRESEARHRLLIERWAQAVWETDADGIVVADSPTWRAYTGQSQADWLGYGWLDAIHPDDRGHAEQQWREAMATHGVVDAEFRLRAPDGGWRWTNVRAVPALDANGNVEKWAGINLDVDARRRAEDALRKGEAKYRALYEGIDEGFCIIEVLFDADGKACDYAFVETNPVFEQQAGFRVAIGQRIREIAPRHEQHWFDVYGEVALTGKAARFEHRAATFGVIYDVFAFRVDEPDLRRVAVLFRDVTARRHQEARLRESEERQTFLLTLSDVLRPLDDPTAIHEAAMRLLVGRFGVARATYLEIAPEGDTTLPSWRDEVDGPRASQGGRIPDFIAAHLEALRSGRTVVVGGADDAPRSPGDRAVDTRVAIAVPLVEDGRLVAVVAVEADTPRRWTGAQVRVLEEIAERTWAAVERARAEAALRASEDRFRKFGDASSDVLWMVDAATGRLDYLSSAFERVWGVPRASVMADLSLWVRMLHPDDRSQAMTALPRALAGEAVTQEYRIVRSDGAIRYITDVGFPIRDASGRIVRVGGVAQDLTERRQAEHAVRAAERRQRALIEGVPQLVWRAVDGGHWTWASPQWTAFTGQSEADSRDWGWLAPVHPDDREPTMRIWAGAIERGEFQAEYRLFHASEGRHRWFQTRATPVRDDAGDIVEWLGTSTDIHELRELQERQRVLVAELQHRTRNLMGVVRAIFDKTARASVGTTDLRTRFQDRLESLARVQGLLSRLREGDRVTFDELIRTELSALHGGEDRVTLVGPPGVRLRSSTVQTLAMALHELATNAVKYGALGQPGAHLTVAWSFKPSGHDGRPWLHVDWRETAVVMPPSGSRPAGTGQGRELIEQALPYQLDAETSYTLGPDGVHCTISIPVSASAEVPRDG